MRMHAVDLQAEFDAFKREAEEGREALVQARRQLGCPSPPPLMRHVPTHFAARP